MSLDFLRETKIRLAYGENFEDVATARIIFPTNPMPIQITTKTVRDFTGKAILFPMSGIETQHIFALKIYAFLKAWQREKIVSIDVSRPLT